MKKISKVSMIILTIILLVMYGIEAKGQVEKFQVAQAHELPHIT